LKIPNSDFGNREFFTLKIPHTMRDFQGKIRNAPATPLSPKNREVAQLKTFVSTLARRSIIGLKTAAFTWLCIFRPRI
jgi:hypothetical protein